MNPLIASSADPNKLSMTVQGVLMALVPVIIALFQVLEIEITEGQVVELIQAITAVIAGVVMILGMLRKFINAFRKK